MSISKGCICSAEGMYIYREKSLHLSRRDVRLMSFYIYISLFSSNRYIIDNMSSRKQRTKQLNNLTFERIDALFEISKTQSIVKISFRFIFESKSSFFQFITEFITNVQNTVFLSKNINIDMNLFDNVTN